MIIKKILSLFGRSKDPKTLFKELHKCLDLFIEQEAKLWGIQLKELKNEQENTLEDINHIIHKFEHKSEFEMKKILKDKDVNEALRELLEIHEDLKVLKKLINRQEVFKNTLTSLTLLLVNEETYQHFEDIFLLEKQLQQVLIWQEEEFKSIFNKSSLLKTIQDENKKTDSLYEHLIEIRNILAGNLDHHELWEDEMQGFSNCSNILHALKAKVIQLEKYYNEQNKL